MIYDNIKNIHLYKGLSAALDTGLDYIAGLEASVELGTYMLDNGVKAIVSESETMSCLKIAWYNLLDRVVVKY